MVVKLTIGDSFNSTVRLVSYNTGLTTRVGQYDVRREKVGQAIKDLKADVVCLQEVCYFVVVAAVFFIFFILFSCLF
jgi:hypothetical protein